MKTPTRPCSTFCLLALLGLCCAAAHAVTPLDGNYEFDDDLREVVTYVTIKDGQLTSGSGFLFNAACSSEGAPTPSLVTDLTGFFQGYASTRVVNRGDGKYLLTSNIELDQQNRFKGLTPSSYTAVYGELTFTSPTRATFTHHSATAFFLGTGMGTGTCIGSREYALERL